MRKLLIAFVAIAAVAGASVAPVWQAQAAELPGSHRSEA